MRFLITGATGFVGSAVTKSAYLDGHEVTVMVRNISDALPEKITQIVIGDFAKLALIDGYTLDSRLSGNDNNRDENDAWLNNSDKSSVIPEKIQYFSEIQTIEKLISDMRGIDVVIHTAARAHVMHEKRSDSAEIYRQMNVTVTERLAEAAVKAGVKRFVFLSSIKVNGESTIPIPVFPPKGRKNNNFSPTPILEQSSPPSSNSGSSSTPSFHGGEGAGEGRCKQFTESDTPNPQDPYAVSKWQAEQALTEIGQRSGMEIVILRPPMIYGPGVRGNFANLLKLVNKGIPLPFGNINNQRSLLALDNLVSAIILSAKHRAAANQTFLVADDEAVSTTQLIKYIANAQGKKARLLPIPVSLMKLAAKIFGKQAAAERLFGSLQIDTTKIQDQLGWRPVVIMPQQLEKMFHDLDYGFPSKRD